MTLVYCDRENCNNIDQSVASQEARMNQALDSLASLYTVLSNANNPTEVIYSTRPSQSDVTDDLLDCPNNLEIMRMWG